MLNSSVKPRSIPMGFAKKLNEAEKMGGELL
jgi:hypothetical protein